MALLDNPVAQGALGSAALNLLAPPAPMAPDLFAYAYGQGGGRASGPGFTYGQGGGQPQQQGGQQGGQPGGDRPWWMPGFATGEVDIFGNPTGQGQQQGGGGRRGDTSRLGGESGGEEGKSPEGGVKGQQFAGGEMPNLLDVRDAGFAAIQEQYGIDFDTYQKGLEALEKQGEDVSEARNQLKKFTDDYESAGAAGLADFRNRITSMGQSWTEGKEKFHGAIGRARDMFDNIMSEAKATPEKIKQVQGAIVQDVKQTVKEQINTALGQFSGTFQQSYGEFQAEMKANQAQYKEQTAKRLQTEGQAVLGQIRQDTQDLQMDPNFRQMSADQQYAMIGATQLAGAQTLATSLSDIGSKEAQFMAEQQVERDNMAANMVSNFHSTMGQLQGVMRSTGAETIAATERQAGVTIAESYNHALTVMKDATKAQSEEERMFAENISKLNRDMEDLMAATEKDFRAWDTEHITAAATFTNAQQAMVLQGQHDHLKWTQVLKEPSLKGAQSAFTESLFSAGLGILQQDFTNRLNQFAAEMGRFGVTMAPFQFGMTQWMTPEPPEPESDMFGDITSSVIKGGAMVTAALV